MKKVFLMLMAAVAIGFTSCANKPANNNADEATEQTVEANADDAVSQLSALLESGDVAGFQSALDAVKQKIAELVAANPEIAKEYLGKVQGFLKENAEKIQSVVGENAAVAQLVSSIADVPAESVIEGLKSQISGVGEAAQQQVEGAVEGAKEAVQGQVDAAKEAAQQQVDAAKEKAANTVDEGAAKLKKGLGL